MNISYHPKYKSEAAVLRDFLKSNNFLSDVNYVIGGDGSLFIYKSLSQRNILISPDTSKGYYSLCKIADYKRALTNYFASPSLYDREFYTISVRINDKLIDERAVNDILICEGLEKTSHLQLSLDGGKSFSNESNSGIIIYTSDGLKGWSKHLGASDYGHDHLGVAAVLPLSGILSDVNSICLDDKLVFRISGRNRDCNFRLFVDCKNSVPFDMSCTDRSNVAVKPYDLMIGDVITIERGEPIIIAKA